MSKRAASRSQKSNPEAMRRRAERRRWWIPAVVAAGAAMLALGVWAILSHSAPSPMDEARAALKARKAAVAERALERASEVWPSDPEPWLLRLELLRLEDRQVEAQRVGWQAYDAVRGQARRAVLSATTLAMLADTPDNTARDTLPQWIAADPDDVDAQVALLQRIAASPRATDPDRASRLDSLTKLVADHPEHIAAREALVLALADAGHPEKGRAILDAWPESGRDARYHRLVGRWALEYDRKPAVAIEAFRESLKELPQDWRTRYRLARALRNAGKADEAKKAADDVERLREALDPVSLGRRLDHDLEALDDPKSRLDLADLCARTGLTRLAEAWRRDADGESKPNSPFGRLGDAEPK